jgi:hypothetical protein
MIFALFYVYPDSARAPEKRDINPDQAQYSLDICQLVKLGVAK